MRHTHNVLIKNVMLLGKYKNYGPKNLKWAIKKTDCISKMWYENCQFGWMLMSQLNGGVLQN